MRNTKYEVQNAKRRMLNEEYKMLNTKMRITEPHVISRGLVIRILNSAFCI